MAITLIASIPQVLGVNGGTTGTIDTTGATLMVVSVGHFATAALQDSKLNTWTPLTARLVGGMTARWYYCLSPAVGILHSVTVTGAGIYAAIQVYAFAGVGTYQTESGATTTGSGPLASGSVTPSVNGALVVTTRVGDGVGATDTLTPVGFTTVTVAAGGGINVQNSVGVVVQATAAAINPTWAWSPSVSTTTAGATAVFLPVSLPPGTTEPFVWGPL